MLNQKIYFTDKVNLLRYHFMLKDYPLFFVLNDNK